jgi:hypothetical protein
MRPLHKGFIFWLPRVLTIAFAVFIGMFALDAFSEGHGFRETAFALAIHLIPAALVVLALALAWRWEWVGTLVFGLLGFLYLLFNLRRPDWILVISAPLFVVAALFLLSWLKRSEFRSGHSRGTAASSPR